MSSGLYNALSGAKAQMQVLDVIANNLANASTTGFKGDRTSFETMLKQAGDPTAAKQLTFTTVSRTVADQSQGTISQTGVSLDLAIDGEGFFKIQGPSATSYTRHGAFRLNNEGQLVTPTGLPLLGENGPITLSSADVNINKDGIISFEGAEVGRIPVYAFEPGVPLEKRDDGLFVAPTGAEPNLVEQPTVVQGGLEMSNVNVMKEMTRMTQGMRAFEAYQKMIKQFGDLGKSDELGSVG